MAKININEKIEVLEGVQASVANNTVTIKGSKGEITREFKDTQITLGSAEGAVTLACDNATKREKARAFAYRAHIRNMMRGVTEGHKYELKICSSHFPMNVSVKNNTFTVKNFLGEKIPRVLPIKEGADVKVDGTQITVESNSKEVAGQVAADIEQLCRITNRDRRIFQDGIYIINKDGKDVN